MGATQFPIGSVAVPACRWCIVSRDSRICSSDTIVVSAGHLQQASRRLGLPLALGRRMKVEQRTKSQVRKSRRGEKSSSARGLLGESRNADQLYTDEELREQQHVTQAQLREVARQYDEVKALQSERVALLAEDPKAGKDEYYIGSTGCSCAGKNEG